MAFSFFFRDLEPLTMAITHLIPATRGRSRVRIWDAGCAMGQEPYTLAILLAESLGTFAFRNVEIHATDYDAPLLHTVREAVYPWSELQRIPKELFEKYFEPAGEDESYRVIDEIRRCVLPASHNLLSMKPIRDGFSLIVCKNVLLHFQASERIEVIKMYHAALEVNGYLIMEHTQKMPQEINHLFEQMIPNCQLYRKQEVVN